MCSVPHGYARFSCDACSANSTQANTGNCPVHTERPQIGATRPRKRNLPGAASSPTLARECRVAQANKKYSCNSQAFRSSACSYHGLSVPTSASACRWTTSSHLHFPKLWCPLPKRMRPAWESVRTALPHKRRSGNLVNRPTHCHQVVATALSCVEISATCGDLCSEVTATTAGRTPPTTAAKLLSCTPTKVSETCASAGQVLNRLQIGADRAEASFGLLSAKLARCRRNIMRRIWPVLRVRQIGPISATIASKLF